MDMEQEELQFLGLFGIYKETFKLIYKLRKILSQITLALILPLSFIFLAQERISELLFWKIRTNEFRLHSSAPGSPKHDKLSDLVSAEWAEYVLLKLAYFAFVLVFSLLSTSAVVYTVACAYTARDATFTTVMSVVPKVWKRLMITFLCAFFAFFLYNIGFVVTLLVWSATVSDSTVGILIFVVVLILYGVVFVYLTIVWQLASVVSVLEDSRGIEAMMKGKRLMKGKMVVAAAIFLKLNISIFLLNIFFKIFVVYGSFRSVGLARSLGFGVFFLVVLLMTILFGLVVQTVLYLVCKSYHHENIDKSALSDHLEVYLGDYVPLMAKNVQMEDLHGV
ncbi:uncharacterized protein LOC131009799 [Salvia miltiorrhiza]|uniref:uncharacterized protein LOC131009799 n=1 Tax=Salvia miltiorrhiza TaxID=226208 RepID=UPI0025AD39DA|nr:uncharacterized protein LOC131009799 [Salvia miltiorrhiza]